MEKSELPQSKIGSEEPIFASPLLKAGAKIAPHRGARAIGPPFHISRANNNLPYKGHKNNPARLSRVILILEEITSSGFPQQQQQR